MLINTKQAWQQIKAIINLAPKWIFFIVHGEQVWMDYF